MVTLIEEEIPIFEGVPLVPVQRLNAFISELDNLADGCSFAGYEEEEVPDDLPEEPWDPGAEEGGSVRGQGILLSSPFSRSDNPPEIGRGREGPPGARIILREESRMELWGNNSR
jgi:hypothetical protein